MSKVTTQTRTDYAILAGGYRSAAVHHIPPVRTAVGAFADAHPGESPERPRQARLLGLCGVLGGAVRLDSAAIVAQLPLPWRPDNTDDDNWGK